LAGLSEYVPRVIALIDMPDLRWQVERSGGTLGSDLTAVVQQLEAGLAALDPARPDGRRSKAGLPTGTVYVYSPLDADRPAEAEHVVFKQSRRGDRRECWGCYKECTHCQAATGNPARQGLDNPIADDLIELARDDAFDWAVVVSTDLGLISVVRFVQSHGRKIIHGCFPPLAMDLTRECWASIDLRERRLAVRA